MSFLVTARRWRPMVFEDVIGQEYVTTTLRNAILAARLSHAYIFSGPRGVGKTTTARILAKAINCLRPNEANPDNTCELCTEITENRSLNVFEIDGASNRGIDEIRNLREAVRYGPARGKYKVYVIDEVHMLTKEAFNALLKTLEEPPQYVIFIFATTEIHKVPLTILSRCQRFDFRRIAIAEIISRLKFIADQERVTIDNESLYIVAKRGDGSLRDAQSLFDQLIACCGTTITSGQVMSILNIVQEELYFRLAQIIKARDVKGGLLLVEEVVNSGHDLREFVGGLSEHFRNMLVASSAASAQLIETSDEYKKRYDETKNLFSENDLLRFIKIAGEVDLAIRWNQQPRLKLEIGIIKMIKMDSSVQIQDLLKQLDELKKKAVDSLTLSPGLPGSDEEKSKSNQQPVRGNVKATQPILRPDQIVSPQAQRLGHFSLQTLLPAKAVPAMSAPSRSIPNQPTPLHFSRDEAQAKWPSFVDEVCKRRIAVGTMLRETQLVDVEQGRLQIHCTDDFHLEELKRNRQFLTELAQQVYGAKVLLETMVVKGAESISAASSSPTALPAETLPNPKGDVQQHPVTQAIIKHFKAVEVRA